MAAEAPICDVLCEATEYLSKLGSNLRTRTENLKERKIRKDKLQNAHAIKKAVNKVLLICDLSKKSLENVEKEVIKIRNRVNCSQRPIDIGGKHNNKKELHKFTYESHTLKIATKIPIKHYMSLKVHAKKMSVTMFSKYPVYYNCKLYRQRKRLEKRSRKRCESGSENLSECDKNIDSGVKQQTNQNLNDNNEQNTDCVEQNDNQKQHNSKHENENVYDTQDKSMCEEETDNVKQSDSRCEEQTDNVEESDRGCEEETDNDKQNNTDQDADTCTDKPENNPIECQSDMGRDQTISNELVDPGETQIETVKSAIPQESIAIEIDEHPPQGEQQKEPSKDANDEIEESDVSKNVESKNTGFDKAKRRRKSINKHDRNDNVQNDKSQEKNNDKVCDKDANEVSQSPPHKKRKLPFMFESDSDTPLSLLLDSDDEKKNNGDTCLPKSDKESRRTELHPDNAKANMLDPDSQNTDESSEPKSIVPSKPLIKCVNISKLLKPDVMKSQEVPQNTKLTTMSKQNHKVKETNKKPMKLTARQPSVDSLEEALRMIGEGNGVTKKVNIISDKIIEVGMNEGGSGDKTMTDENSVIIDDVEIIEEGNVVTTTSDNNSIKPKGDEIEDRNGDTNKTGVNSVKIKEVKVILSRLPVLNKDLLKLHKLVKITQNGSVVCELGYRGKRSEINDIDNVKEALLKDSDTEDTSVITSTFAKCDGAQNNQTDECAKNVDSEKINCNNSQSSENGTIINLSSSSENNTSEQKNITNENIKSSLLKDSDSEQNKKPLELENNSDQGTVGPSSQTAESGAAQPKTNDEDNTPTKVKQALLNSSQDSDTSDIEQFKQKVIKQMQLKRKSMMRSVEAKKSLLTHSSSEDESLQNIKNNKSDSHAKKHKRKQRKPRFSSSSSDSKTQSDNDVGTKEDSATSGDHPKKHDKDSDLSSSTSSKVWKCNYSNKL